MENFLLDNSLLIFGISMVGVVGALILMVVGYFMWQAEQRAKTGQPDTPPADAAQPITASRPNPLRQAGQWFGGLTQRLPASADPYHVEVARVLRDRLTGQLVVQVEGKRYAHPSEATDPRHARALAVLAQDWAGWWQGVVLPAPPPPAPPAMPASAAPVMPSPVTPPPAPEPPAQPSPPPAPPPAPATDDDVDEALNKLPPVKHEERPLSIPSMNIVQQFQKVRAMSAPVEPARPVAEQIDDILQLLIAGTAFASRQMRVYTGADGAAVFTVDSQIFVSLNDVSDPAVQKVFRRAVQEWEHRHYRTG